MGKGNATKMYLLASYRESAKMKKGILQCFRHLSELTRDDPLAFEKLTGRLKEPPEALANRYSTKFKNLKVCSTSGHPDFFANFGPKLDADVLCTH